jgi:hypothetical protein
MPKKGFDMLLDDGKTKLSLDISVENDLEVDAEGVLHTLTFIFVEDNDDPVEVRLSFEEMIENLIDFYRDDPLEKAGYRQMYSIANEFVRHADRLRDVAGYMEDRNISGDLFSDDIDPEEPEDI